jgi:hypothetical protein
MASGDTGNVVPGNRLWVRVPCPPLQVVPRFRAAAPVLVAAVVALGAATATAEPPASPQRSGVTQPRSGTTSKFGSGTITRRSDGTTSETRPFGSGSITTERRRDGSNVTGQTQKFGSGTITRWSDGSTTETRPFGSGTITTERDRQGRSVTGQTQKFGSGTITRRSDGSSSTTQPFGSGMIQRDEPGRSSSGGGTKRK